LGWVLVAVTIGCTFQPSTVASGSRPALRAAVFFNNLEGKGSHGLMRAVWTIGLSCILPIR
jgi:hypothetical protein